MSTIQLGRESSYTPFSSPYTPLRLGLKELFSWGESHLGTSEPRENLLLKAFAFIFHLYLCKIATYTSRAHRITFTSSSTWPLSRLYIASTFLSSLVPACCDEITPFVRLISSILRHLFPANQYAGGERYAVFTKRTKKSKKSELIKVDH